MLLLLLLIIIAICLYLINSYITRTVKANSTKISELKKTNEELVFFPADKSITVRKHYDNKSNYNKIQPAYVMAADIKRQLSFYSTLCNNIQKNNQIYKTYISRIELITSTITAEKCKELKIPLKLFLYKENQIFKKNIQSPTLNLTLTVIMTYSSPKKQVNLMKQESFTLNNVFACMESVSRSHLDKATYNKLAAVERGDVSDSLRYDILKRDEFRCVICGASSKDGAHLHVDHIIPIAKGGKSVPSNLRTLCERCNIGKSDKLEVFDDDTEQKTNKCPLCNGELVLRKGKYNEFLGCSNYPRCKYTQKIIK